MGHFWKCLYWICNNITVRVCVCVCMSVCVLVFWLQGILAPQSGIEPVPPTLEGEVLNIGSPWKFLEFSSDLIVISSGLEGNNFLKTLSETWSVCLNIHRRGTICLHHGQMLPDASQCRAGCRRGGGCKWGTGSFFPPGASLGNVSWPTSPHLWVPVFTVYSDHCCHFPGSGVFHRSLREH